MSEAYVSTGCVTPELLAQARSIVNFLYLTDDACGLKHLPVSHTAEGLQLTNVSVADLLRYYFFSKRLNPSKEAYCFSVIFLLFRAENCKQCTAITCDFFFLPAFTAVSRG